MKIKNIILRVTINEFLLLGGRYMQLVDGNLKLSLSTENEMEKLNEIFIDESKFFLKIEGEIGPRPYVCFSKGYFPANKSKEDFKMLSCYDGDELIGWTTIIKGYPNEDIYYISHFSIVNERKNKGYGKKFIDMLCNYFKENKMNKGRVLVSLKNWEGIRFWYKCGFDKITCTPYDVSYSEENFASIELEKTL